MCSTRLRTQKARRSRSSGEPTVAPGPGAMKTCSTRGWARRAVSPRVESSTGTTRQPRTTRPSSSATVATWLRALAASSGSWGKKARPGGVATGPGEVEAGLGRHLGHGSRWGTWTRIPAPSPGGHLGSRGTAVGQALEDGQTPGAPGGGSGGPRGRRPGRRRRRRARTPGRRGRRRRERRQGPERPWSSFGVVTTRVRRSAVHDGLVLHAMAAAPGRRWPWCSPSGYTAPSLASRHRSTPARRDQPAARRIAGVAPGRDLRGGGGA